MNTDIKSLIPSMHAELKHMQSRVAELQVSLQHGSSAEKTIREVKHQPIQRKVV